MACAWFIKVMSDKPTKRFCHTVTACVYFLVETTIKFERYAYVRDMMHFTYHAHACLAEFLSYVLWPLGLRGALV